MLKENHVFPFKLILFLGILCSLPAFLFSYNHVLNLFYSYGCPLEDQGVCAHAMWRNELYTQLHPSISEIWGKFFFPVHFSPIFSLTSVISKFIEINMIDFYAYFHGLSHGLLATCLFFVFCRLYNLTSLIELSLAVVLSILFSFNGISISSIYYPHYEMLFLPLAVFFLTFLIQKQPILALPFFILSLSIRECSGFHLFSIIFFLILIELVKKERIYKPFIYYGITAFFYSTAVLIIQKYLLTSELLNFSALYIGSPPYSHLSWELIKERALFIMTDRRYFYVPIFLILAWSILSKRFYIAFGVLALIPWFLFNFLAISTWAAGLYFYYGIYYLLIFFWPLLAIKLMYGENITNALKKEIFTWYSLIILASVLFNNPFTLRSFFLEPGVSQRHTFQRLQSALLYNSNQLGNVVVDAGIASLAPESFSKKQVLYLRNTTAEERKKFFTQSDPKIQERENIDSLFFYNNNYIDEGIRHFYILSSRLPYMYQVIGTNVYLASNRLPKDLPAFSSFLTPIGYDKENLFKQYVSNIFQDAHCTKEVNRIQGGFEIPLKSPSILPVYSNPIRLPKGQYCIQFGLNAAKPIDPQRPILTVDVASQNESQIFFRKDVFLQDLPPSLEQEMRICFEVKENLPNALISIRFLHYQNAGFLLKNPILSLEPPSPN